MEPFILVVIYAVFWLFLIVRLHIVGECRIRQIHIDKDIYDAGPSLNQMLFNPKHYLKWTRKQMFNTDI
jgi:hypothetical protein